MKLKLKCLIVIIYDPERGADALNKLKDLLVYLRDDRNEELKAMYSEESPVSAPILFYFLNMTLDIHRTVYYFDTYIRKFYKNNPICNAYIYPYLCSLDDIVEL